MWRDIKGYEGLYQVSSEGEVKSLPKQHRYGSKTERILIGRADKDGYLRVSLSKDNKVLDKRIHRLVAESFITNTENKPTVNHKNGIVSDNNVYNLEWATHSEQNYHLYKMGLKDLSYMSKLNKARYEKNMSN